MTFRIAESFSDSLARLATQEQKAAKTAAFDLQKTPDNPGLSLHRVDRARDKGFWTARVNRDIRLVLHKQGGDTLLAWVGHHDDAYAWAERRRLESHPRTGAMQIVEIRETVEEVVTHHAKASDLLQTAMSFQMSQACWVHWVEPCAKLGGLCYRPKQ